MKGAVTILELGLHCPCPCRIAVILGGRERREEGRGDLSQIFIRMGFLPGRLFNWTFSGRGSQLQVVNKPSQKNLAPEAEARKTGVGPPGGRHIRPEDSALLRYHRHFMKPGRSHCVLTACCVRTPADGCIRQCSLESTSATTEQTWLPTLKISWNGLVW